MAALYRTGVNMRFNEFKVILREAKEVLYYSVGDSHSQGVSAEGKRPGWKALGKNGSPSTAAMHMKAIQSIPKGSVVAISLGANDLAMFPNESTNSIANRVSGIVNAATDRGLEVVFLLPTLPAANKPKDPRREQLRKSLSNVINVPIIDLGIAANSDPMGLHLDPSGYAKIATQVTQTAKSSAKTATEEKPKKGQGAQSKSTVTTLAVPTGRVGPEVADIQKVLIALGYELPKHGVDGVRGPETVSAVKQFQRAAGVTVDGDPGPETVAALNKLISSKGVTFTKSTSTDVKGTMPGVTDIEDSDIEKLGGIEKGAMADKAKASAETYLGRPMSDDEWDWLVRATGAESSYNVKSYAMVMGSILNRARSYRKNGVIAALKARNQFQAVTGTAADGHRPSPNFVRGPNSKQLKAICTAAIQYLPRVSHDQRDFTATNPAAYGKGTNIGYLHAMRNRGGQEIAGSHFNTELA